MLSDMTEYARDIGIAFQILDDILDFEGDAELIGKSVGKDQDLGKCNYVCVFGSDQAHAELHRLTEEAITAVSGYSGSGFFTELASGLEVRKY